MPSAQFARSVAANVTFWRQHTAERSRAQQNRLYGDRNNLFKAAQFGVGLSDTWRETSELLLALRDLFDHGIYWIEWVPILERVIAKCDAADLALKCRLLNLVRFLYRTSREIEKALICHLEAEQIAVRVGDRTLSARCHLELSRTFLAQRKHEAAECHALEALIQYEALVADPRMVGSCYMNIGLAAHAKGQLEKAEVNLRKSVQLFVKFR